MPITSMFWFGGGGHDIHVLRGSSSRDLTLEALHFSTTGGPPAGTPAHTYLAATPDVTLTFTPLFKGTLQGTNFVGDGNGITVDTSTGIVTVDPGVPVNRKNNFIMEVAAKNNTGTGTFNETIRVQVHGSVTQVWLTPSTLTIRGIDNTITPIHSAYRFAVRAQFDDDLVGDLTDGHGVVWHEPSGHLNAAGRVTISSTDHAGDHFGVTATLPAALGGATTPAGPGVRIGVQWSDDPARAKIHLVAGGAVPAAGTIENSANVLFVSDGFGPGDEDAFGNIVDLVVHFLRSSPLANPYNLLAGKMNFWKVFFPANQLGISFQSEMAIVGLDALAKPIPAAKKPAPDPSAPNPPNPWDVSNLFYMVGLPVPADANKTSAALIEEWKKLLPADPTPHIPPVTATVDVIAEWKFYAKRAFIEQQDNFFGMTLGNTPAANEGDTTLLRLHPDRATLTYLRFLSPLLASDDGGLADGRPLGVIWSEDTFRFHNRDYVIMLSAFRDGRPANYPMGSQGRYVGANGGGRNLAQPLIAKIHDNIYIPVHSVFGKNTYTLDFTAVDNSVNPSGAHTLAHELGHSLGLGDEYSESAATFPKNSADAAHVNLETDHDAGIPDPNDATKILLKGDQITWTWHRIAAAAVVGDGPITDAGGGQFRIPVLPDVTHRFAQGDTVLLRQRRWGQFLHKLGPNDVSKNLVVAGPPGSDFVNVSAAQAGSVTPADLQAFAAGTLLYKPKPAAKTALSPTFPFAQMVAKTIQDAITKNNLPLTDRCIFDGSTTQIPFVDDGPGRQRVDPFQLDDNDNLPRVVGLYSGGATYSCGIYHPAGLCMMRNSHDAHAEFCAVCRYIIVDLIAPDLHPKIDAAYDKAYPES
jgi:hypothetical protein